MTYLIGYIQKSQLALMKEEFDSIVFNREEGLKVDFHQRSLFMGSALIFLNLFLMSCVGVYWTNPSVHQYFSGRPL